MQPIYSTNDLRNIAFEPINDRFSKGIYLGIEVTIDMTTGYVNGSHLVSQVKTKGGEPKRYEHWRSTAKAESFVQFLSTVIAVDRMTTEITDVPNELKGTYVHPQLIPHLAQWASDEFAYKVGTILNSRAISDAIANKNEEIRSLKDMMNAQSEQIAELLSFAREAKHDADEALTDREDMANELVEVVSRLDVVQSKLGIAVEDRVPKDVKDNRNEVLVFFVHRDDEKLIKVIRRQKRGVYKALPTLKKQGFHTQIYETADPNTVNIWNRVRDSLPSKIGRKKTSFTIELSQSSSFDELFEYIRTIADEKRII